MQKKVSWLAKAAGSCSRLCIYVLKTYFHLLTKFFDRDLE